MITYPDTGNKQSILLDKSIVSQIQDDIIEICIKENSLVELEDVEDILAAENQLMGEQKRFVLFVTPGVGIISKEAREFSANATTSKNAIAKAIIVRNVGMRLISNFFITVNKPPVKHKIFETKLEALNWFEQLREQ
jgi:hypothetical protein